MAKTVLITGGSRGIGRETAIAFSEKGYNVVINYSKSESEAQILSKEINCLAIKADVSDYLEVFKMINTIFRSYGKIDVLVNNAGIAQQSMFCDISEQDWDNMFNVNIKGMFNCCKCILPKMINEKQGKIINVSSIWGITGSSCEVHYSASKAAVIGFTKALAKEMGPSGININCVAPGVIETDMNAHLDFDTILRLEKETPLGTIGSPRDIANIILFLASEEAKFITGQVISPNGGIVI